MYMYESKLDILCVIKNKIAVYVKYISNIIINGKLTGLRSRWAYPLSWIYATAETICLKKPLASSSYSKWKQTQLSKKMFQKQIINLTKWIPCCGPSVWKATGPTEGTRLQEQKIGT